MDITDTSLAQKMTQVGTVMYFGEASPGTKQSDPHWRCWKVDLTSGLLITWANGNDQFINVATDLTTLSYS